jgi:hypothetical protein
MAVFDATTNGAVCEPTVVSMRTIRSRAACCVRRERTAAAPARGRSKHVPLHPDRFQVPPRSASRGWKIQQHETIVVTYPQAVESKHWHGTVSIRSDELPGQIEEPRLERAPRCRGTMQGCQPRLSVRRLERVPVVSAIVPAREPVEAPGSR